MTDTTDNNELKGNQFEGKEDYVKDVFEEIAEYYDKMNDIMSIGHGITRLLGISFRIVCPVLIGLRRPNSA